MLQLHAVVDIVPSSHRVRVVILTLVSERSVLDSKIAFSFRLQSKFTMQPSNDDPLLSSMDLPRNYDSATHARRMSQLREQTSQRLVPNKTSPATVLGTVFDAATATAHLHHHADRHSFLYSMLNPLSHRWQAILFKRFITMVILLDLLFFIVSTDPTIGVQAHGAFFQVSDS